MNDDRDPHHGCEAYVLGALESSEHERFERHLDSCASCRREIEAYATVRAELASIAVPPPPAAPRAPRTPRVERRSNRFVSYAAVAAAMVAIVGGIAVPRYEHDRASERAYADIARMLATDPIEVALVGASGVSGRAIVGEAHRRSGFVVRGLPAAAPGFVYRVWVGGVSLRRSPGVLEITPDGLHVLVTPGDVLERASSIRVMLEATSATDTTPRRTLLEGRIGERARSKVTVEA
ncbi:MAG: hypothetical protein NVSMB21_22520 [Vulcanimicrobiaceae bacterium]